MANPYYTASGAPVLNSNASSSAVRAEFLRIAQAFDKLGALPPNKMVRVSADNSGWVSDLMYEEIVINQGIMTFLPPGDLSVSSTTTTGAWVRLGALFALQFQLDATYTITTAGSQFSIMFPQITFNGSVPPFGSVSHIFLNHSSFNTTLPIWTFAVTKTNGMLSTQFRSQDYSTGAQSNIRSTELPSGSLTVSGVIYGFTGSFTL